MASESIRDMILSRSWVYLMPMRSIFFCPAYRVRSSEALYEIDEEARLGCRLVVVNTLLFAFL